MCDGAARYHAPMCALARPAAVNIRPMRRADVRAAVRIERDAYGSRSPRTTFRRELLNGLAQYLVADVGESDPAPPQVRHWWGRAVQFLPDRLPFGPAGAPIAGYAGAWFTHDQLHLVTLAVAPQYQGRGIGQALLLAVCDLAVAADLDSVALEVRSTNARAVSLYARHGFRSNGRLRNYYSDNGEDALVMLLDGLDTPEGRAALDARRAEHAERYGVGFVTRGD
ncbi:MAG: ribosomal-protein-alanine N-acetyltransferase [Chloroflexi bacterium]|nr:ribosomal-protein-alanine N-acetyltransferase [Chloroflexota bacterium]